MTQSQQQVQFGKIAKYEESHEQSFETGCFPFSKNGAATRLSFILGTIGDPQWWN
jgi:hypothetical protein